MAGTLEKIHAAWLPAVCGFLERGACPLFCQRYLAGCSGLGG